MSSLFEKARTLKPFLAKVYLIPLLGLFAITLASTLKGIPMYKFMRDPSSIAHIHPFAGVMSNLGVLLWCASATICLFGWAILCGRTSETKFSNFFLYFGLMTILLMLDDLFRLHESIFPNLFGVPEKITFIGYGVLTLCGMITFKKCIIETEFLILLLAFIFFGLSLTIDLFFSHSIEQFLGHWRIFFEDCFKLLGIVGWFGYFGRCCFVEINSITESGYLRSSGAGS
jgi:hypothetical protein